VGIDGCRCLHCVLPACFRRGQRRRSRVTVSTAGQHRVRASASGRVYPAAKAYQSCIGAAQQSRAAACIRPSQERIHCLFRASRHAQRTSHALCVCFAYPGRGGRVANGGGPKGGLVRVSRLIQSRAVRSHALPGRLYISSCDVFRSPPFPSIHHCRHYCPLSDAARRERGRESTACQVSLITLPKWSVPSVTDQMARQNAHASVC